MAFVYRDEQAERRALACAVLIGKPHRLFGTLTPDDFYLGLGGFNGWLYSAVRSAANRRRGLSGMGALLTKKNRQEARCRGVQRLASEIASLWLDADSSHIDVDVSRAMEYAARLIEVREYRERLDRLTDAAHQVERDWSTNERQLEAWRTGSMGDVLVVTLPLPPKELHPNYRGRSKVAAIIKTAKRRKARADAWMAAKAEIERQKLTGLPWASATFEPSFKLAKRNDDDNLIGWLKCYRDGIADAGLVNDDYAFHVRRPVQVTSKDCHEVVITMRRIE